MSSGGSCHYDCLTTAKILKIRGLNIGKDMQERLKSGRVTADREYNYEKQWTEKLKHLDEKHTTKNKLTDLEAARIICKIGKFFEVETPSVCQDYKKKV